MSTIGTTMITSTSLPSNTAPETVKRRVEEGRVVVVARLAQPHGQEQAERDEQVGDADGDDREDQPGRFEEDAQEQELDQDAEQDRGAEPERERQVDVPTD